MIPFYFLSQVKLFRQAYNLSIFQSFNLSIFQPRLCLQPFKLSTGQAGNSALNRQFRVKQTIQTFIYFLLLAVQQADRQAVRHAFTPLYSVNLMTNLKLYYFITFHA